MTTPLGAELGRLAAPAHSAPYDDVRLALLDAVIAANSRGDLDQESWESAFSEAARSLRLRVLAEAEAGLIAAAARSRYPSRRLSALLPDAEAADTLLNRLLAEGMPLERFEGAASDPATRRARAAALEVCWDGATQVVSSERARWRQRAEQVAAWRRPTPVLWVLSGGLLLLAAVVAAWLGGALPAPRWFAPINDLWWRLWP